MSSPPQKNGALLAYRVELLEKEVGLLRGEIEAAKKYMFATCGAALLSTLKLLAGLVPLKALTGTILPDLMK